MFKPLPIFIGLRYTRAKRKNHFISFISGISMTGLILGVTVLIVVLSVMNGFDYELRQRVLGMVPHATITKPSGSITNWQSIINTVEKKPGIEAAAPFVQLEGMITKSGGVNSALIYGIDPKFEHKVSIIDQHMARGSIDSLQSKTFNIVLGALLAEQLQVHIGDYVTVVLPETSINLAGIFPRFKRFRVSGIFSVGADIDGNLAYISLEDAAKFSRIAEGVQGIRLKMENLFDAPKLSWQSIIDLPGSYYVSDWTKTHGRLFQAIQMEKSMVGLLLALIVAVAAFNIIAMLVMVVTDKQSDIAILKTFGATQKKIMAIFIVQGSVIGLFGTALGVLLGVIGALNVSKIVAKLESLLGIHFLSPEVYFITYLPSKLELNDVIIVSVISLTLSFLATIYPAWSASKVEPAEALRYE